MGEHILLEAQKISTEKILDIICPHIANGLKNMYNQASKLNKVEPIKMFQLSLNRIPVLPQSVLKSDYHYLINEGNCDEKELSNLIKSLFICHSKLQLVSQGLDMKTQFDFDDLEIPTNIDFIHQCYVNSAREIYKNAYLFSHKYTQEQHAQNSEFINQKISKAINKTIRDMIPFNALCEKYINNTIKPTNPHRNKKPKSQSGGNVGVDVDTSEKDPLNDFDHHQKNNLESLMDMHIDTSFVGDFSQKSGEKLNSENLEKLQSNIGENPIDKIQSIENNQVEEPKQKLVLKIKVENPMLPDSQTQKDDACTFKVNVDKNNQSCNTIDANTKFKVIMEEPDVKNTESIAPSSTIIPETVIDASKNASTTTEHNASKEEPSNTDKKEKKEEPSNTDKKEDDEEDEEDDEDEDEDSDHPDTDNEDEDEDSDHPDTDNEEDEEDDEDSDHPDTDNDEEEDKKNIPIKTEKTGETSNVGKTEGYDLSDVIPEYYKSKNK
jgi:hypothetical protein